MESLFAYFSLLINVSNLSTMCLWFGNFCNNFYIIFVSAIIGGILQTYIQIQELVKKEKLDEKKRSFVLNFDGGILYG